MEATLLAGSFCSWSERKRAGSTAKCRNSSSASCDPRSLRRRSWKNRPNWTPPCARSSKRRPRDRDGLALPLPSSTSTGQSIPSSRSHASQGESLHLPRSSCNQIPPSSSSGPSETLLVLRNPSPPPFPSSLLSLLPSITSLDSVTPARCGC